MRFLGSLRNAAELLPGYRAYAHAAEVENCPFVLIESAAYGLPMLASPVGGVPEVVVDGKHGLHWALDDPRDGAQKLIALLEDRATYARLARSAREHFESRFNAEQVGPLLVTFLLGIAK